MDEHHYLRSDRQKREEQINRAIVQPMNWGLVETTVIRNIDVYQGGFQSGPQLMVEFNVPVTVPQMGGNFSVSYQYHGLYFKVTLKQFGPRQHPNIWTLSN